MSHERLTRAQAVAWCKKTGGNSKTRGSIRRLYDEGGHMTLDPYNGQVVIVLKTLKTSGSAKGTRPSAAREVPHSLSRGGASFSESK